MSIAIPQPGSWQRRVGMICDIPLSPEVIYRRAKELPAVLASLGPLTRNLGGKQFPRGEVSDAPSRTFRQR